MSCDGRFRRWHDARTEGHGGTMRTTIALAATLDDRSPGFDLPGPVARAAPKRGGPGRLRSTTGRRRQRRRPVPARHRDRATARSKVYQVNDHAEVTKKRPATAGRPLRDAGAGQTSPSARAAILPCRRARARRLPVRPIARRTDHYPWRLDNFRAPRLSASRAALPSTLRSRSRCWPPCRRICRRSS